MDYFWPGILFLASPFARAPTAYLYTGLPRPVDHGPRNSGAEVLLRYRTQLCFRVTRGVCKDIRTSEKVPENGKPRTS
jgi:hypothetical protein